MLVLANPMLPTPRLASPQLLLPALLNPIVAQAGQASTAGPELANLTLPGTDVAEPDVPAAERFARSARRCWPHPS